MTDLAPDPGSAEQTGRLAEVGAIFRRSTLIGLVVLAPPRGNLAHVLVPAHRLRETVDVLSASGWRWRAGADGPVPFQSSVQFTYDEGFQLFVHAHLPTAPLPPGSLRRLERVVLASPVSGTGPLRTASAAAQACVAAVMAARATKRRGTGALGKEVWDLLDPPQRAAAAALATRAGIGRALASVATTPAGAGGAALDGSLRQAGERVARAAVRRVPTQTALRGVLSGRALERATVRCRFGGVELLAGHGVFLPRAASEPLVDAAFAQLRDSAGVIVDVGTGCGAVALALAHRSPSSHIVGTDIDELAVRWARRNARAAAVARVAFVVGGLLDPVSPALRGTVDVIVANVPCVPSATFQGAADAPRHAYVGSGDDGLGLQRILLEQARSVLRPGGSLVLQMAPAQWRAFSAHAATMGYESDEHAADKTVVVGVLRVPG